MQTHCLLLNNLRKPAEVLVKEITQELGVTLNPVPFTPLVYLVDCEKSLLTHSRFFTDGLIYVQNISSIIPVLVLDPQPEETVLDLCAAPGGKTIHMALRMHNTGTIVANDNSRARLATLTQLCKQYGITQVQPTNLPGQRLWQQYPNAFDRVLLDAPCSMQGTDHPSSDAPQQLAKTQKWLLRCAYSACKPGGSIVYSTCTTTQEENEDVIEWILTKEAGNISVIPISPDRFARSPLSASAFVSGLLGMRISRTNLTEGFFIALLRKSTQPVQKKHI